MLQKIFNIGVYQNNKQEAKKIILLNRFCFSWVLFMLFFIVVDSLFAPGLLLHSIVIHSFSLLAIGVIYYLQYSQKYTAARMVFVLATLGATFVFSNIFEPSRLIENFYFLFPLIGLILIDKPWINQLILAVSVILYTLPNRFASHYPTKTIDPIIVLVVFIGTYVILNYSKNLNLKNESLLAQERDKAITTTAIIEKQKQELQELHQFQAQFFVNVSHEIRTPLTLIQGYNAQMQNIVATSSNPLVHQAMLQIEKQTQQIKKIVDDVIDLSKLEAHALELNKQTVAVSGFITRIFETFTTAFSQKEINFSYNCATHNACVFIDALYLERALTNILHNALKYTEPKQAVLLQAYIQDNLVYIAVKDHGIGIPSKDLDKIFNRFYQVNNDINTSGGSGVGLAFSKEIIELHQGQLVVESILGTATTFTITLPLSPNNIQTTTPVENLFNNPETPPETPFESASNTSLISPSKKILIVEDHLEMRAYLKQILSDFYCLEANNGIEALEVLNQQSVAMVITDYMMPKMDGYTLVQKIKQKLPNLPILMLTARSEPSAKLDILRFGVNDYMQKPFQAEELLLRVQSILHIAKDKTAYCITHSVVVAPAEKEIILSIKKYIEEHISAPLQLIDIIEHFSISKSTLYRIIKAETGLGPNNFIKEIRLQCARKYIEEQKHDSIKALAHAVGYSKPEYFSKLYKKRFQVSSLF